MSFQPRVAVVMPVYNEEEGLKEFVLEVLDSFTNIDCTLVVIDDQSVDSTPDILQSLKDSGLPVVFEVQRRNCGHGPSTMRALRKGLSLSADWVVAVDGDGQIRGADVLTLFLEASGGDYDVVEGVRKDRREPWFRRLVSHATRLLVFVRTLKMPSDANTPFRAYKASFLEELLKMVNEESLIPNLRISSLVRVDNRAISEVPVSWLPRRGMSETGTAWGPGGGAVPSRNFLRFCFRAVSEWLSVGRGTAKQ